MHGRNQLKKIRDLNYASLIKSKGFNFCGVEWVGDIAYWMFEDQNNEIDDIIQNYMNGNIVGNLKAFADAQKTLKEFIFNRKNTQNLYDRGVY